MLTDLIAHGACDRRAWRVAFALSCSSPRSRPAARRATTHPPPAAGRAPGGGPPPAEVGVVTVAPRPVGLVTELPGRLEASRVAQVRARAAGILQKRLFVEGSDVKAGQPLFQIDPAPLPERRRRRAGDAGARPGQRDAGGGAGRALQAAARSQRDQQAGLHQRRRRAEDRRGRRRRGQGQPAERPDQPRLRLGDGADLGPHRPRPRHRRRARRPGRGDAARGDPADQPDVRQLHAVDDRRARSCAAPSRAASSGAPAAPIRRA